MKRIVLAVAILLCAGCAPADSWDIFVDRELNITFAYDPSYVRDGDVMHTEINHGEQTFAADVLALRKGMGAAPFLEIMQTKDPLIVSYLLDNSFSNEKIRVSDHDIRVFVDQGMGDPVHYLFEHDGTYVALTFVFPPGATERERTLYSVVLR